MKKLVYVSGILSLVGLVACGKNGDSTDEKNAVTSGTTRVPAAGSKVQATSVAELGLSNALQIELPPALQEGTGLRLNGTKSIEACLLRESAKTLIRQIQAATSMLCHIEAEGKTIPWNKPVILDLSQVETELKLAAKNRANGQAKLQGPPPPAGVDPNADSPPGGPEAPDDMDFELPTLGIYVKEAADGNVEVYLCSGKDKNSLSLEQAFKITGSKKVKDAEGKDVDAAAGRIHISADNLFGTFKGAFAFDSRYTDPKASSLALEVKFSFDLMGNQSSFAQKFNFGEKDGLVKLGISEVGTASFDGNAFSYTNAGVGLFDAENGQVFYTYNGGEYEFSTQACVDSESNLVDCGDSSKFAQGGALYLTKDEVPGVLPATFTPKGPEGFDCKTAEWSTVTPGTDAATVAAHDACYSDAENDLGMQSCFGSSEYVPSDESVDIDFEPVDPGSFENDITEYQEPSLRSR